MNREPRALTADTVEPPPSSLATGLGHLALLPFLAGAAATWLGAAEVRPLAAQALSVYAAAVLSFIGALHWGLAFPQTQPARSLWVWGVLPSLVACAAVWAGPKIGLLVHAAMLAVCLGVDRIVYPRERVARWLPLRLRLTVVAAAAAAHGGGRAVLSGGCGRLGPVNAMGGHA